MFKNLNHNINIQYFIEHLNYEFMKILSFKYYSMIRSRAVLMKRK
jgi:hypothetical protein